MIDVSVSWLQLDTAPEAGTSGGRIFPGYNRRLDNLRLKLEAEQWHLQIQQEDEALLVGIAQFMVHEGFG